MLDRAARHAYNPSQAVETAAIEVQGTKRLDTEAFEPNGDAPDDCL